MIETAPKTLPNAEEIERLNAEFETAEAEDILRWAIDTYSPRIATTSSFGASSGAILHMISQIDRNIPVIFLQTHYHFGETLKLRDQIADKYGLTVENWEAWGGRSKFLADFPDDLHDLPNLEGIKVPEEAVGKVITGHDLCCWVNKVEPQRRALRNRLAYITSLRRDGGSEVRKRTRILELYRRPDRPEPMVKINPMANWSKSKLWHYIDKHQVPVHELFELGYKSIGCSPASCTMPVAAEADERSGRWSGTHKLECGIHSSEVPINFSI